MLNRGVSENSDGDMLKAVLPHTARLFQRAIIMPNLVPPVSTLQCPLQHLDLLRAACAGVPQAGGGCRSCWGDLRATREHLNLPTRSL
eukprot:3703830-Rhodomonas_salina.2